MTRCRHDYFWLPCGTREIRDSLYMADIGICSKCSKATSRVRVAGPGDVVSAMLWGSQFEARRVTEEPQS